MKIKIAPRFVDKQLEKTKLAFAYVAHVGLSALYKGKTRVKRVFMIFLFISSTYGPNKI